MSSATHYKDDPAKRWAKQGPSSHRSFHRSRTPCCHRLHTKQPTKHIPRNLSTQMKRNSRRIRAPALPPSRHLQHRTVGQYQTGCPNKKKGWSKNPSFVRVLRRTRHQLFHELRLRMLTVRDLHVWHCDFLVKSADTLSLASRLC